MKVTKSKKANLEHKRFMFFQIGLVLTLGIVLAAFEWTTVRTNDQDLWLRQSQMIEEEMAEITVQKKQTPEMPKPQIIHPIEIVDDNTEITEDVEITAEVTDQTVNDTEVYFEKEPETEPEEETIFTVVQHNPTFPGGDQAFLNYLYSHIQYPKTAIEAGIEGPVYIEFVVWKDGSIRNARVYRGIGGGCDEEALRVIKEMPDWIPGMQRTMAVNVKMVQLVTFKLK